MALVLPGVVPELGHPALGQHSVQIKFSIKEIERVSREGVKLEKGRRIDRAAIT